MSEQYWTPEYLSQLSNDGEADVARKLAPIYARYSLSVTSGTAEYDLEDQTREIRSITWKGFKVWPLINQTEAINVSGTYRTIEKTRPDYYLIGSGGMKKILFIPIPQETISKDDSNLFSRAAISTLVIIGYQRLPDRSSVSYSLPDYLARRTIKPYVLSRAYAQEGKGQNLKMSAYYDRKYGQVLELYKSVREKYFGANRLNIGNGREMGGQSPGRRYARLEKGFTITPL